MNDNLFFAYKKTPFAGVFFICAVFIF